VGFFGNWKGDHPVSDSSVDGWRPIRTEEFPRFAPRLREQDYPPIDGVEYPLVQLPRAGGFGFVYRAMDKKLKRDVAVKVAHRPSENAAEAVTLARFRHPNIVTVYDTGFTANGRRYIVTEWLGGGSLADKLKAKQVLSPRQWAEMFEKLAAALDVTHVTHDNGFLHRDIKPDNILFAPADPDWFRAPKLADFGLAVSGTTGPDNSGTRAYQAPEHCAGTPSRFSDVYSLGVTLWQCLTGEELTDNGLSYPPPSLQGIPATLAAIVRMCLAPEPLSRYGQSDLDIDDVHQCPARALAQDLRWWLDHKPTRARPLNLLQRSALWVQRSPGLASTFAALGLGLVVSGTFAYRERVERARADGTNTRLLAEKEAKRQAVTQLLAETEAKLAAERRYNIRRYARQLERVQEHLAKGDSPAAVMELDRCDPALRGWEWDHLRSRCDSAVSKAQFPGPIQALAVGPDGRLAVALAGGKIHLGPWGEGLARVEPLREREKRIIRRMWFTADRLLTASTVRRGTVVAGVLDGHAFQGKTSFDPVRELFLPPEFVGDGPPVPVLSPDGTVIFAGERGLLKGLDRASGRDRLLLEKLPPVTALAVSPEGSKLAAIVAGEVRCWKWPGTDPIAAPPENGPFRTLAFASDGTLALVNESSDIRMWKLGSDWRLGDRQPPPRFAAREAIRGLVFSPMQPETFVTLGRTLILWSPGAGGFHGRPLVGHGAAVSAVTFSPDGRTLFSGDTDGVVREYNTEPMSNIKLAFAAEVRMPGGSTARVVEEQVELKGRLLALVGVRATGLALDERKEPTRLLIETDQRRVVVVDVRTEEVLCMVSASP
jgi:tRNA A-37 threonylcarbamoyl transferase component Bud32